MTIPSITGEKNYASSPSKLTKSGKENSTPAQLSEKKQETDSFDVTAVTNKITAALESSITTSVIDENRVNAVKDALEKGTYTIDAQEIAKKMIQMERENDPFNNSR